MKLLSATPSPYARKVRIALAEKGLDFELLTEVPWNRDASAPQYNPLGKIPVLLLDDGSAIYESSFILQWLELKHPAPAVLPGDPDGIIAARQLEVLADGICDAIVLVVIENTRAPEKRSDDWIARQDAKIRAGVAELARRVSPDTPFAGGDTFGLGDIAVGTVLGYLDLRYPQFRWRPMYPNLVALADRLAARPSFRDTVPSAQTITDRVA